MHTCINFVCGNKWKHEAVWPPTSINKKPICTSNSDLNKNAEHSFLKKNGWSTCQSVIISDIGIREPDVGIDIQRKMKSFHIFWLITNCYTWFLIKFTDIHSPICVNKGTDINLPVLVVIWHVSLLNFHCDEIQLIY